MCMKILKKILDLVMDGLEGIIFVGSLYIVVYIYLFMPTSVIGSSMEPNLHNRDRLIVDKVSYRFKQPERGDIVVIKSPKNPDIDYIKRLVGLSGDTILIKEGKVFINGVLLPEDFVTSATNVWDQGYIRENQPFIVPNDYVFVMGDNRERSSDSREFGPIPISSIVGQVPLRYYPPDKFGLLVNPLPENLRD